VASSASTTATAASRRAVCPHGERANPAGGIDARLGYQPGGRCRADARERPHYGHDPHPARRLLVLGQGLSEGQLACLQPSPEPLPLGSQPQALEARSLALIA
jgi:hypothetical protein